MTVLASTIMDRVAALLLDEETLDADRRWPKTELLDFLNAAQRMCVLLKPTSYTLTKVHKMVAGVAQTLPDGVNDLDPDSNVLPQGVGLVRINRNMGSDGATPGNPITRVDKEVFDQMDPSWTTADASTSFDHWIPSPKENDFSVYPQCPVGLLWVELEYYGVPPVIVANAGPDYDVAIGLEDIYAEPIRHYMLFNAFEKDAATSVNDAVRAVAEYNTFVALMGRKDLQERNYKAIGKKNVNTSNRVS